MASKLAKRHAPPRPNPWKAKLAKNTERLQAIARRTRAGIAEQELSAITVGTPVAFAFAERNWAIPTVMGLDPAVLYGGAMALIGLKLAGKNGRRLLAAGCGLLASGARDSVKRGGIKVGEDEIAGEEIGADEFE